MMIHNWEEVSSRRLSPEKRNMIRLLAWIEALEERIKLAEDQATKSVENANGDPQKK